MNKRIFLFIILSSLQVLAVTAAGVVQDTVTLVQNVDSVRLSEVVMRGSRISEADARWNNLTPVQLVTVGGANGDLYKALQTMPGTQVQGETGRLLVRGGSSEETQTFIDGMHVMNPYTSTSANAQARSRYSTFLFSGISLASGGASLEYGDALSAVLPLETKDRSSKDKLGTNLSTVGTGAGGTKAFENGSVSFDLNYQNLRPYNSIFKDRTDFEKPYTMWSAASQLRITPTTRTVFKTYIQYDKTDFAYNDTHNPRLFRLNDGSIYINSTLRHRTASGWNWFTGVAWSRQSQNINGASVSGDEWLMTRSELHLKVKTNKRLSDKIRIDASLESYLRRYGEHYKRGKTDWQNDISPSISAFYTSLKYSALPCLAADISIRAEHTTPNRNTEVSPRLSLSYATGGLTLSGTVGKYTQMPECEYLLYNQDLLPEVCLQYNAGAKYESGGRFYSAEIYYKRYSRLPLNIGTNADKFVVMNSDGEGYSKGLDLFFRDDAAFRNMEYQLAYSFNISKRRWLDLNEMTTPQYATRHNVSLVLKYTVQGLRSIISLTERFGSGRPFHNPSRPGIMNDNVEPYNSIDLGWTFLPAQKVIIHASATNILGRKNVFGKNETGFVRPSTDRFFYVGVFLSLGKNIAYNTSNF